MLSEETSQPLVRYNKPTSLDIAPFGTQWLLMSDNQETEIIYIQLGLEDDNPNWQTMGYLLEENFECYYQDEKFVRDLLKVYKHKHTIGDI